MFLRPPGLSDLATCTHLPFFSFRLPLRTSFFGLFLSSGMLSVDPSVASWVPKSPTSVQLTFVALLDSFYLRIQRGERRIQEAQLCVIGWLGDSLAHVPKPQLANWCFALCECRDILC